jgi:hypothetical protein
MSFEKVYFHHDRLESMASAVGREKCRLYQDEACWRALEYSIGNGFEGKLIKCIPELLKRDDLTRRFERGVFYAAELVAVFFNGFKLPLYLDGTSHGECSALYRV